MHAVDYNDLNKKIHDFCRNKVYIENIIEIESVRKQMLNSLINIDDTKEIGNMKQVLVDDFSILEYELINSENGRVTKNIMIVRGELPVVRLEHYEDGNYVEDSYSIYSDGSNRLSDRLSIKSYKMIDNEHLSISILGQFSNTLGDGSYFRKKYSVYITNGNIQAINTNDTMYIENEAGFDNILRTFDDLISRFSFKLNQKVDNLMGDNVQEYHIKRKKQEC